ncbi:hypothetical protein Tco_0351450 [Tanacetum coccineum]
MVVEEEVKEAVMASYIWRWNTKSRSESAIMKDMALHFLTVWQCYECDELLQLYLHGLVDDLETTSCFLDDQEIRHGPRRIANPETNLLVIGQAANHCHNRQNGKGCCLLENANLVLDQV